MAYGEADELAAWLEEFSETAKQAGWSDETAISFITMTSPSEIVSQIKGLKTLESCIQRLLSYAFPETDAYKYDKELMNTKQNSFYYIGDYDRAIRNCLRKYGFCARLKPQELILREHEFFMRGLHPLTHLEVLRLGFETKETILVHIQKIEKTMEQLAPELEKLFLKESEPISMHKTDPSTLTTESKYCSRHGGGFHNTSECRALKANLPPKKKDEINKSKSQYSYVIKAPEAKKKLLELVGTLQGQDILFQIDPGATISCIGLELTKLKKLNIEPCTEIQSKIATGDILLITGYVNAVFSLACFPNLEFKERLYVIPGKLEAVLLGETFLFAQEALIDYRQARIRLAGTYIYLDPNTKEFYESPDGEIYSQIYNVEDFSQTLSDKEKATLQKFSQYNPILGTIPNSKMEIKIDDTTPIHHTPYSTPMKLQDALTNEIGRLMKLGIITKSTSQYTSPVFIIPKKDGSARLIVDYRKINSRTISDSFPFPDMHAEIRSIPQSSWFSKIDLSMGYHQVKLEEDSRKYTSFVTAHGHFEYTRVPFGLKNAPWVFQRVIREILGEFGVLKVFLDDILIFSNTRSQHLEYLEKVLERLTENNIAINYEKSQFFQRTIVYLGHSISHDGIRPDITPLPELRKNIPPKSLKGIQKLCGILNWFRPFIPSLSTTIKSITDKLSTKAKFNWTKENTETVEKIIGEIQKQNCLAFPNYDEPICLHTDASEFGMGGILSQKNKILGYFSRKFSPTQAKYTVSEKELLAIIEALKYFRTMVFMNRVNVFTDHKNILYDTDMASSRFQRWKLALSEYDITINHISGKENNGADMLSRCFLVDSEPIKRKQPVDLDEEN